MSIRKKIKKILNALVRRTPWFNRTFFEDCKKFWQYNTFNTEIVNLGSTSALYAFNYDDIGIKAANWAISRNPLLGDLAILKNYSGYLNTKGSTVIIPLCPFSSLAGSYDYMDDRYYTILYPSTIAHYSYIHYLHVLHKRDNPFMYYPVSALFTDAFTYISNLRKKKLTEQDFERDAQIKIESWMHEFSLTCLDDQLSLKNRDAISDAVSILNEIIRYCKKKKAKVIITVPPMHRSLASKFSENAKNVLIDSMVSNISGNDISYKNYMYCEGISDNDDMFENSFLLNDKGAREFTRILLREANIIKQ